MAQQRDDEQREGRADETAELTLGELEFDPPTSEIEVEELEEVAPVVTTMTFGAPGPMTPGLGRPRRDKKRGGVSTLKSVVAPPPPSVEGISSAPPSAAPEKRISKLPAAARRTSTPPPPPPSPAERPTIDESPEALRSLLQKQLDEKPEPERAARLAYELGRLYEIELDDLPKAAEHYQAALRHAPDHIAAIHGARRTLAALGRHAALPALFDAEIKATREPKARARLTYAKARVMEEHLRQPGQALKVYREALALDPGNVTILKALERGLRRDKAWTDLAAIYEQLANAVEDPALRAAWLASRARLTEVELKDPVLALALYEAAIDADPHATAALASLKRLSVDQKRWPELVAALRREHELTQNPEIRLAILATIARIQEQHLGDADAAVASLERAVALRPNEPALVFELARLHRNAGRHAQEAEALARLVEHTENADARASLCHRIGRLFEQELGDRHRARSWYERALEEDASHRAAALALVHLHESRGDWEAVARVWTLRADAISSVHEQARIFHRVGTLVERRLGQTERAAELYARALGLDPDHGPAFDDLSRLYARFGRWNELAELYQRAIDRAPNAQIAIAWLFRLGGILEDRLDDPDGALIVYERILEHDSQNIGALHAVARAAERAQRWDRLTEALLAEARVSKEKARAHALRHRAAQITADALGDPAAAARSLEALLEEDPQHRPSLDTLSEIYSSTGQWEELVGVYRRLLPILVTTREKVQLLGRIGEIQELQLADDGAAIEAYREALRLDPDHEPAREALLRVLERSGAPSDLASALEEKLERTSSPRERARVATELGMLLEQKLGRRDQALAWYRKALEAVPLYRPALDAQERLLTQAADWKELVQVLEAEARASRDPVQSTHAALRAALVLADQHGAVGPALEAFRPVFDARPDHIGALLAVEEIYARTRDEEGLAVTFAKMAEIVRDPKAKLAALQELARARASAGGDTIDVHRKLLRLAPDDASALEAIAAEAQKSGDRDSLLAMHARLASTAPDPTVGAFHQTRVGEILLSVGDAPGALAAFRAALDLDPRSAAATRGLTRAAHRAGDADALRQAATREDEVTGDRRTAVNALLTAAKIRRNHGDLAGAAADYEAALALDPDDETAEAGLRATRQSPEELPRLLEHLTRAALAAKTPARACALHLAVARLQADARGDLPAAVAATQRALAARPEDAAALARLGAYLERNGQWREASETLERLIAKAQGEELVEAHLRLAHLAEARLEDPGAAIRNLRAVLKRQPRRADAIAPLIRLERNAGREEEALRLAKSLLEVATDQRMRADALAEIAQLEMTRGHAAEAAKAAIEAIGMLGPRSPAARVYRDLVVSAPSHANWDDYASALLTYLERQRPSPGEVSLTYRELARIFAEAHNRPDRAIATLREGSEACPGDAELALALASALAELGAHEKAIGELRRLLAHDVRIPAAWRALADRARSIGEVDGGAIALAPLCILREANEEETRIVQARMPRVAKAPAGILGETGLKQIIHAEALDGGAAVLMAALTDVIAKLEGIDYERYGLNKRDRIRAGDPHPIRAMVDRIAAIFAAPEVDLFVVKGELPHAVIEPGNPPALLIPAALEHATEAVLAFELARPLALLARQVHPVDRIAPDRLERLLIAAVRQYEPEFAHGATADLEAETKRVAKALPWLQRGRIQEAAMAFVAQPPNVAQWIQQMHQMATRAALLVADDLGAAVEALGESLGPPNTATDLALFWISDPAMRFRRAVAQQL